MSNYSFTYPGEINKLDGFHRNGSIIVNFTQHVTTLIISHKLSSLLGSARIYLLVGPKNPVFAFGGANDGFQFENEKIRNVLGDDLYFLQSESNIHTDQYKKVLTDLHELFN